MVFYNLVEAMQKENWFYVSYTYEIQLLLASLLDSNFYHLRIEIIHFKRCFFFEPNRYITNIDFIDLVPTIYEPFSIQLTTTHHKTRTPPISHLHHIIGVHHTDRVSVSIIPYSKRRRLNRQEIKQNNNTSRSYPNNQNSLPYPSHKNYVVVEFQVYY